MESQNTNKPVRNISADAIENDVRYPAQKPETETTNTFDTKNYLNVRLGDKELKKELKIRVLPVDKDSDSPFKIVHMHTLKVPKDISPSGWKSYVCLEKAPEIDHERLGNKCPFCDANREAYEKFQNAATDAEKDVWKEISLANKASRVGILRCIERGHEEDGPKFWKFNLRKDEKDPMGTIKALYNTRNMESIDEGDGPFNILDIYNGKDLLLTINAVIDEKTGKPNGKTNITITDYGKPKPLSQNDEDIEKWVNDSKRWCDVFVAKPYEYLKIVLDGGIPWFDRNTGKWVPKIDFNKKKEDEKNEEKKNADKAIDDAEKAAMAGMMPPPEPSEEALPF